MPSVTISDRTSTGDPTGSITLPRVPDGITLRELIRLRVREEVARYNLRPSNVFRGLVQPVGSEPVTGGFNVPERRPLDWSEHADVAVDQFLAHGYVVLVNGAQITDLDTRLDLSAEHLDVRFIRLTPLAGD
jgi:hypothetical protein